MPGPRFSMRQMFLAPNGSKPGKQFVRPGEIVWGRRSRAKANATIALRQRLDEWRQIRPLAANRSGKFKWGGALGL